MAEVERLRSVPQPAEGELPPFDITIVSNLAGERQIHLRSPVTEPITPAEAHRRADALMQVVERQRSLIEIRILEDEWRAKTDALEKVWKARKTEAEAKHAANIEALTKAVVAANTKIEQAKQAGHEEWTSRGRRTDYNPDNDNRVKMLRADHGAALAKITQAENEHLQNLKTIDDNIEKLEADLREINRHLARHREIVG